MKRIECWLQWLRPFWRCGKISFPLLGLLLAIQLTSLETTPELPQKTTLQTPDMNLAAGDLDVVMENQESLGLVEIASRHNESFVSAESSANAGSTSKMMIQRISAEETEATGPPAFCAWLIGLTGLRFKNPKKERNKMKHKNTIGSPMKKASSSAKCWFASLALLISATPLLAAPANDNLANATVISGSLPISVGGSNVGATVEPGEPSHSDSEPQGGHSVWWSWTPSVSGPVTITTENSGTADDGADPFVDTQVGVYTGNSIGTLVLVAKKEDSDGAFAHGWTRLTLNVTAGTNYKIAVDGWNGAVGRIQLNIFEGNVNQTPSDPGPSKSVLNLQVIPAGAGAITAEPAQPEGGYEAGTVVTLTVGANPGNNFSTWSGSVSGSGSTVQVTMNGLKTVSAIFNSDHQILFENPNRVMAAWFMESTNFLGGATLRDGQVSGPGWKAVAVGDFDNDGHKDILWQNSDGRLAVWLMDGTNFKSSVLLRNGIGAGPGWRAAGFADFDGGGADVLFQHQDGRVAIWRFNNMEFVGGGIVEGNTIGAGWKVIGATDMNGDSQPDIIFQHTDGRVGVWLLNGTTFASGVLLRNGQVGGPGWRVAAFSDLNNDGSTDLIWQNADGRMAVWFMDGTTFINSGVLRTGGIGWRVVGAF